MTRKDQTIACDFEKASLPRIETERANLMMPTLQKVCGPLKFTSANCLTTKLIHSYLDSQNTNKD